MHALSILHRALVLHCPWMHAKRRDGLLAAVRAAIFGSRLMLSDLGRGLRGPVGVNHNIKRVDRLLGNAKLHAETAPVYELLARHSLVGVSMPLIVVDWSDLSADRCWQLLRASVALEGRSRTRCSGSCVAVLRSGRRAPPRATTACSGLGASAAQI